MKPIFKIIFFFLHCVLISTAFAQLQLRIQIDARPETTVPSCVLALNSSSNPNQCNPFSNCQTWYGANGTGFVNYFHPLSIPNTRPLTVLDPPAAKNITSDTVLALGKNYFSSWPTFPNQTVGNDPVSGLSWAGNNPGTIYPDQPFILGRLQHWNFPIYIPPIAPCNLYTLNVNLKILEISFQTTQTITLSIPLQVEETPNSGCGPDYTNYPGSMVWPNSGYGRCPYPNAFPYPAAADPMICKTCSTLFPTTTSTTTTRTTTPTTTRTTTPTTTRTTTPTTTSTKYTGSTSTSTTTTHTTTPTTTRTTTPTTTTHTSTSTTTTTARIASRDDEEDAPQFGRNPRAGTIPTSTSTSTTTTTKPTSTSTTTTTKPTSTSTTTTTTTFPTQNCSKLGTYYTCPELGTNWNTNCGTGCHDRISFLKTSFDQKIQIGTRQYFLSILGFRQADAPFESPSMTQFITIENQLNGADLWASARQICSGPSQPQECDDNNPCSVDQCILCNSTLNVHGYPYNYCLHDYQTSRCPDVGECSIKRCGFAGCEYVPSDAICAARFTGPCMVGTCNPTSFLCEYFENPALPCSTGNPSCTGQCNVLDGTCSQYCASGDVINQLDPEKWKDGILYESRELDDLQGELIYLDRVLSQFENGWQPQFPHYYFKVVSIVVKDQSVFDLPHGDFFDVDDDALPTGYPFGADHVVANNQGLIYWRPNYLDHEHTLQLHFQLVAPNATKNCTLIIERHLPCRDKQGNVAPPLIHDTHGNLVFSTPVPGCRIHYDADLQRFTLNVTATYIHDGATYLIDFDDFNPWNDTLRVMDGSCSNRDNLPGPAVLPFREMWYSAPTATFPAALAGGYSAYPVKHGWSLRDDGCAGIVYNTSYSFNELTHCRRRQYHDYKFRAAAPASLYAVNYTVNNGLMLYTGKVYVNILAPPDPLHEDWGYSRFRHIYPFQFGFKIRVSAIVGVPTQQDLRVFIRNAAILADGSLLLVVETQYARWEGLKAPSVSPATLTLSAGSDPCSFNGVYLCIQTWTYTKAHWGDADNNVTYTFRWQTVYDGFSVSVPITLSEKLQQVQSETGLDLGSIQLRTFTTVGDMMAGINDVHLEHTFNVRDPVYIRSDLIVIETANFDIKISNVWLCYSSIEGYEIEYVQGGKQGCLDPMIQPSERFHLIVETQLGTDANVQDFSTNLLDGINTWINPYGPSDGFSFLATPQETIDRIYTIHVETMIFQKLPSKRSAPIQRVVSLIKSSDHDQTVEYEPQTHVDRAETGDQSVAAIALKLAGKPIESENSHLFGALSAYVILAVMSLLGAIIAGIAAVMLWRRQHQNQPIDQGYQQLHL